ncbi:MAG: hypothetical protein U0Y08_00235 [Bacteroidia bacterium]
MLRIYILSIVFILFSLTAANGQYALLTFRCDSTFTPGDTLLAEYYNLQNKLIRKVKYEPEKTTILYEYDSTGTLISKKHRSSSWELIKTERFTKGENGDWKTDSVFGKRNELLMALLKTKTEDSTLSFINWFYRMEETPMTVQKIKTDGAGNELSNSTCYAVDNCVTYVYRYTNNRKTGVELWVLSPDKAGMPVLTESEELIYDTGGELMARIRFSEPDHEIIERNKYVKVPGLRPSK